MDPKEYKKRYGYSQRTNRIADIINHRKKGYIPQKKKDYPVPPVKASRKRNY